MKKLTIEHIREKFNERGYTLLTEEYINSKQKLEYMCPNGHKNEITWSHFQQGTGCSYCSKNAKLTIEQVREAFEKEGYILLSKDYINSNTKLKYLCPNGHEHEITWNDFRSGYRCPFCKEYKGEKVIRLLLEELNIEYKTQYKFKDCKYKNVLKFDFYLPKYNMCIEYDGEGHYQAINWGGKGEDFAKRRLKSCQIRDGIKTQYCKDNNINLLRIPYWDFKNIENILKQELNLE